MKKKLKKETPVIKTSEVAHTEGTVGEFVDILKQFPKNAKFTLNGSVGISGNDDHEHVEAKIYKPDNNLPVNEPFFNYPEEGCITDECNCDVCTCENAEDENPLGLIMEEHLYGVANENPVFLNAIRHTSTDHLIESPLMMPNKEELHFEGAELRYPQLLCIDEIRQHNAYVAECMAELHRREIAALLEYNTQCLAHFGVETNKVMCEIVDKDLF